VTHTPSLHPHTNNSYAPSLHHPLLPLTVTTTTKKGGSQEFGQCGTGVTGEFIVSAGRVAFKELNHFTKINPVGPAVAFDQVSSGACHSVALTKDGIPYSWGCGAYGRLGHGKPADVLVPTIVNFFELDRYVS